MSAVGRSTPAYGPSVGARVRRGLAGPGSRELLTALLATVIVVGAALVGFGRVTSRPADAGVSLALADATANAPIVLVHNGGSDPFEGRLVVDGRTTPTTLRAAPGQTLEVRLPADDTCRDRMTVAVTGPGAPSESVVVACTGAGS
jgi:hypothetical protein